jgi:hypothetical protein
MARKQFNFDSLLLDGFTTLIHGARAAGKTHFLGDYLATEAKNGPVRFINMLGEDGQLSAQSFGLGNIGETHETYDDYLNFCKEYAGRKLHAVALDSVSVLGRWAMRKVVGSDRLPTIAKSGPNEWGEFHREMDNAMVLLRSTAKYVVAVCPSDRSVDALTTRTYISPDLPGRQAVGSAGWFDFVAYLTADVTGPGQVRRQLIVAPNSQIVVRQRLSNQIVEDITLPTGPGGWTKLRGLIESHATAKPVGK